MEGQSPAGKSQYQYQSDSWSRLVRRNTLADSLSKSASSGPIVSSQQVSAHLDLLPILLPLQPSFHQEQLDRYNRLITSGRTARLHSSPVPPLLSAQHIQAVPGPRFGSGGGNTDKNHKSSPRTGHGNKDVRKSSKGERPLITEKEVLKMPAKKFDLSKAHPAHPLTQHHHANAAHHSSSVPSTPHQHARKFSFESREPSPTATNNHSPRSAYSESNSTLPSLRPLPPPRGCRFETAMTQARRRMAYSLGTEKLDDVKSADLKSELTEEEEKRLSSDMRELYDRLLPTPESEVKRRKLVEKLVTLLNNEWPGHDIQVHVFGSSGNLLCTDESDVDICITTPWKELEGVCMIAELLARSGMERVICVSSAKVPIVKIWDPELSLACDMNVNNVLALENTRMVKTYVQIDPRVRPLAMIVKHWTKRRILNDAAFGGTLSSYTWICMIIYFLQSRNPPILPALHEWPGARLTHDGKPSTFADDLEQLKEYGQKNEETLGQLLFFFFRFYGHEFDYDKVVVSVRGGNRLTKFDKKWHLSNNNRLCVEEPFNITRNLGNTADDTSFRGLHMELRRAFDLISEAKLDECCQQYEYPPEEERVWERRAPAPRPILSRSTSQSGRGRGGTHRGGRHSNQNNRNGTGNRRASSGAFDNIASYVPQALQPNMPGQDLWFAQQANAQLHNELFASYSLLQAQETSLRMHLLAQQSQNMVAQAQAYAQSQARMQGNSGSAQQPSDRNRTPTYEQPPLTAPIRPDSYFYPLQYQAGPFYAYHNPSTSPSSPSLTAAVPDLDRRMHRSTVASGSGAGAGMSSSSLRSQSQPASRTAQVQAAGVLPQSPNGLGIYHPLRQANGVIIPNFIADEPVEPHLEAGTYRTQSNSPPEDRTPKEYVGYYVNDHPASPANRRASLMPAAIPAFGDIGQTRRRLSQDQLPPSILDRLRRPSRSPSPLGHDRSFSTGAHSAPITSASSQQGTSSSGLRSMNTHGPLVVNGSGYSTPVIGLSRHISTSESSVSEDIGYETAVGSVDSMSQASFATANASSELEIRTPLMKELRIEQPVQASPVVNGVHTEPIPSFTAPPVVNGSSSQHPNLTANGVIPTEQTNSNSRPSPNPRNRLARQPQNGGVSPLDIGVGQNDVFRDEASYLSPVYEIKTPSPTTTRKFESSFERKLSMNGAGVKDMKGEPHRTATKPSGVNSPSSPTVKANGHTRGSKSETGPFGTWQKIPKNKKKGQAGDLKGPANGQSHSEKPPHNESERKGG
ncbi:hypothetical protein B7463_g3955, partial [Scytalidium lignicola]